MRVQHRKIYMVNPECDGPIMHIEVLIKFNDSSNKLIFFSKRHVLEWNIIFYCPYLIPPISIPLYLSRT